MDITDVTRTVRTKIRVCECGCWYWTGSTDTGGYGKVKIRSNTLVVHRYLWEHFHGPITDNLTVDHLNCPTRRCVNPDHMQLVPKSVNSTRANETRWRDTKFSADGDAIDRRHCDICLPGGGSQLSYDEQRRGSKPHQAGELNHSAVLTEAQVRDIHATDSSIAALARLYGVDRTTIRAIKTGKSWSHLNLPNVWQETQTTQTESKES